jgi:hypothetical protein
VLPLLAITPPPGGYIIDADLRGVLLLLLLLLCLDVLGRTDS